VLCGHSVDTSIQDRHVWIWIYPMDMDISMDIHAKSVDMDMDMDGKFHIHGNPGNMVLEVVNVHVRANVHQAKCSSS